jgi:hypothetical protein
MYPGSLVILMVPLGLLLKHQAARRDLRIVPPPMRAGHRVVEGAQPLQRLEPGHVVVAEQLVDIVWQVLRETHFPRRSQRVEGQLRLPHVLSSGPAEIL